MNPLDALVAASDRLVAWLQPIATEFERLTGSSIYRLAALLYPLSLFLMAGEITIGAARYIRFVRVLTEFGANPFFFSQDHHGRLRAHHLRARQIFR